MQELRQVGGVGRDGLVHAAGDARRHARAGNVDVEDAEVLREEISESRDLPPSNVIRQAGQSGETGAERLDSYLPHSRSVAGPVLRDRFTGSVLSIHDPLAGHLDPVPPAVGITEPEEFFPRCGILIDLQAVGVERSLSNRSAGPVPFQLDLDVPGGRGAAPEDQFLETSPPLKGRP
ncbi:hypothetical protein [Planomonospora sp. ID82291]|uniref:hypothetical protein n=1 Tax=Planomonospora sp. ID82291 TaxID=2738136 RepID=UPI0018C3AF3A|nr:hypothetical protein [Planomonospora sp. ID82291]MBG0816073.1 hypothetical protein [Planomonospora sp. ID82291]